MTILLLANVLTQDELNEAKSLINRASWGDGRVTAGVQSAIAKNNQQLAQDDPLTLECQKIVLAGLNRHAQFFSAALPKKIFPPLFNRYHGETNSFGNHVDNAVRFIPNSGNGNGQRLRTDLSCTLFLNSPEDYAGGELVITQGLGEQRIKAQAGDMVLYSASTVHRVEPVSSGERLACFFWIESMVRDDAKRNLLFEMDNNLMQVRTKLGETSDAVIGLTGTYHNLLRLWAEV